MMAQLSYLLIILQLVAHAAGAPVIPLSAPLDCSPGQMCARLWLPVTLNVPPFSSAKKGIAAAPYQYSIDCSDFPALGVSWLYHWWPDPHICPGMESVPMYGDEDEVGKVSLGGNSPWVMGFNEPDSPYQANVSPADAVEPWRRLEALAAGKWLVSPSVVMDEYWLPDFRSAYHARYGVYPRLDAIGVHCYFNNADRCIAWVQKFIGYAKEWGVWGGVWVSEYHMGSSLPDSVAQADKFTRWLECEPQVTRYAWFTHRWDGSYECPGGCAPLYQWSTTSLTGWGVNYSGIGEINRCH